MKSNLKEYEPRYIIYKHEDKIVFITYLPWKCQNIPDKVAILTKK